MKTDDASNYHTYSNNNDTFNNVWNYGRETWCNLEGQFMHIVADLAHLAG